MSTPLQFTSLYCGQELQNEAIRYKKFIRQNVKITLGIGFGVKVAIGGILSGSGDGGGGGGGGGILCDASQIIEDSPGHTDASHPNTDAIETPN